MGFTAGDSVSCGMGGEGRGEVGEPNRGGEDLGSVVSKVARAGTIIFFTKLRSIAILQCRKCAINWKNKEKLSCLKMASLASRGFLPYTILCHCEGYGFQLRQF